MFQLVHLRSISIGSVYIHSGHALNFWLQQLGTQFLATINEMNVRGNIEVDEKINSNNNDLMIFFRLWCETRERPLK